MQRSNGTENTPLLECINKRLGKWRLRWDMTKIEPTEEREEEGYSFMEEEFLHKPTMSEIKETVLGYMNSEIDNQIVSGYTYQGLSVWLSMENQMNIKASYDLASQNEGLGLPVTMKFGTTEEPQYITFTTVEELKEFYLGCITYIQTCYTEGWTKKDAVDWSPYEELLNKE